jgi:hypothetical protein
MENFNKPEWQNLTLEAIEMNLALEIGLLL